MATLVLCTVGISAFAVGSGTNQFSGQPMTLPTGTELYGDADRGSSFRVHEAGDFRVGDYSTGAAGDIMYEAYHPPTSRTFFISAEQMVEMFPRFEECDDPNKFEDLEAVSAELGGERDFAREDAELEQLTPLIGFDQPFESEMEGDVLEELKSWPADCEYKFQEPPFSDNDVESLCQDINAVGNGEKPGCHPSNCTTASFLALVHQLKNSNRWGELQQYFSCTPPSNLGEAYAEYIKPDGLRLLFKKFGLGETERIPTDQLQSYAAGGWPEEGDTILLQRNSSAEPPGSGHAAVFSHYEGSKICYWTSNSNTNGYDSGDDELRCEDTGRLSFVDVGKLR
ncbi:MAG: hypothetical protein AAF202_04415 [Pseudomonadota bacterium]